MRSTVLQSDGVRSAERRSRGWRQLLERAGPVHTCEACGERMFVRPGSGLCPLCWNGRRPGAAVSAALRSAEPAERGAEGAVREVPSHLALLGVRDEPEEEAEPLPPPARPAAGAPARQRPGGAAERMRRASGILRAAGSRLRATAARRAWRST